MILWISVKPGIFHRCFQPGSLRLGQSKLFVFHYAFNLDGGLCSAFLDAYRRILPLLVEELETVAAVYGWMRVHDLWYYKAVYLEDNQRVRTSFQAGPFIPFEKQWADLRRFLRDS